MKAVMAAMRRLAASLTGMADDVEATRAQWRECFSCETETIVETHSDGSATQTRTKTRVSSNGSK